VTASLDRPRTDNTVRQWEDRLMVVTLKKDGARYIVYSTDRAEAAERLGFVAKDGKWWNADDTTMEHSRDFATRERAVQWLQTVNGRIA
jgi:hypothetical protein